MGPEFAQDHKNLCPDWPKDKMKVAAKKTDPSVQTPVADIETALKRDMGL